MDIGATASLTKTVTDEDVRLFAQVTGDTNPVHLDDAAAKQSRFGERIAHGMLSAGLISAVLGTQLPGPGTIYLGQTLKFRAPVAIGATVTATVTVTAKKDGKPIYTLDTVCATQDETVVLEGQATVLYSG